MKKFMKALALALALCMVLSVSAFAISAPDFDSVKNTNHTVNFTVTGVDEGEQVALLILTQNADLSAANENTILYIDQTAATSAGAVFAATIDDSVTYVDVYVGSKTINADTTTNPNGGAWEIYEDLPVANTSSITLATGENFKILTPSADDAGTVGTTTTGTVQYGVAIKMHVNNLGIDKMIWAFGDGDGSKVYSKAITLNYEATAIEGDTWFTAAVAPSIVAADGEEPGKGQLSTLATVNAIFLDKEGKEHFTDVTDKKE